MKKLTVLVLAMVYVLTLAGCNNNVIQGPDAAKQEDFPNAIPIEVNDNIIQKCISYSENLGYVAGEMEKAVLLGEDHLNYVYCEDDRKQELIDSSDIVVIFENIRCVVDSETEIVLGRIPFV